MFRYEKKFEDEDTLEEEEQLSSIKNDLQKKMDNLDKISLFEKDLKSEQFFCSRIAALHYNSKETIKGLKGTIEELKTANASL